MDCHSEIARKGPRVGTTRGTKRQNTRASRWSRCHVSRWLVERELQERDVLVQAHVACSSDYFVSIPSCRDIPWSSRRSPSIPSLQWPLVDPKMEWSRCVAKCTPILLLVLESVCLFDLRGRVFLTLLRSSLFCFYLPFFQFG
jgi:hypothetical protein